MTLRTRQLQKDRERPRNFQTTRLKYVRTSHRDLPRTCLAFTIAWLESRPGRRVLIGVTTGSQCYSFNSLVNSTLGSAAADIALYVTVTVREEEDFTNSGAPELSTCIIVNQHT